MRPRRAPRSPRRGGRRTRRRRARTATGLRRLRRRGPRRPRAAAGRRCAADLPLPLAPALRSSPASNARSRLPPSETVTAIEARRLRRTPGRGRGEDRRRLPGRRRPPAPSSVDSAIGKRGQTLAKAPRRRPGTDEAARAGGGGPGAAAVGPARGPRGRRRRDLPGPAATRRLRPGPRSAAGRAGRQAAAGGRADAGAPGAGAWGGQVRCRRCSSRHRPCRCGGCKASQRDHRSGGARASVTLEGPHAVVAPACSSSSARAGGTAGALPSPRTRPGTSCSTSRTPRRSRCRNPAQD